MKCTFLLGLVILCATIVSIGCGKKVPPATASTASPAPVVEPPPPAPRNGGAGDGAACARLTRLASVHRLTTRRSVVPIVGRCNRQRRIVIRSAARWPPAAAVR